MGRGTPTATVGIVGLWLPATADGKDALVLPVHAKVVYTQKTQKGTLPVGNNGFGEKQAQG